MAREPILKDLRAPNLNQNTTVIQYPNLKNDNFELKAALLNLLPRFHGMRCEDPNINLDDFHAICLSMCPKGVTEDEIQLRAFQFSLQDYAREWYYCL